MSVKCLSRSRRREREVTPDSIFPHQAELHQLKAGGQADVASPARAVLRCTDADAGAVAQQVGFIENIVPLNFLSAPTA